MAWWDSGVADGVPTWQGHGWRIDDWLTPRPEGSAMNTVDGRTARTVGVATAALAALAATAVASLPNLNGDVRYALGGLETAGGGGVSVWDIFISRPLAYKLV